MNTDKIARVEELCRSYLIAMENGNLEGLLATFTDEATATSPISGMQPVREFYSYVMRVTSARSMELKAVFTGISDPSRAAIHVVYTRRVGHGEPAAIEVVDVFELNEDCSRFAAVRIIYDTAPVRSDFDRPETRHP